MSESETKVVLVVDDDSTLREMVRIMLTTARYKVLTASDGQDGLDQVAREMPDLILLDMKMPRMSGWEFAAAFHAQYDHRCPIVVLSAAQEAAERADDIGAEGYLDKPFPMAKLLSTVAEFLAGSSPA